MGLADTIYGVKAATRDILAETLNEGLPASSPERVDVFYGWEQADSPRRMVVVGGGGSTAWVDGDGEGRFHAASSLRRYSLYYTFDIAVLTNVGDRTEEAAEREAYRLFDRCLTPLIRGDSAGRSMLQARVPAVQSVMPVSDQWTQARDEDGGDSDRLFTMLQFTLTVELIRE